MEPKMTEKRTKQDFLKFLDWLGDKGLMPKNTVAARKAAVSKVLSILSDEEAHDVTKLNLDEVMRRFNNLEGNRYTPGSLTTYLSRVRSALDDFAVYLDNPLGFRPSAQTRVRRTTEPRKDAPPHIPVQNHTNEAPTGIRVAANALSIPIRPDTTIVVQGLPYDLSETEAAKIANVIRAMALPSA